MSYIVSCYDTPKLNYMTFHLLENNNHKTHFRVVYVNLTRNVTLFLFGQKSLGQIEDGKKKRKNLKKLPHQRLNFFELHQKDLSKHAKMIRDFYHCIFMEKNKEECHQLEQVIATNQTIYIYHGDIVDPTENDKYGNSKIIMKKRIVAAITYF